MDLRGVAQFAVQIAVDARDVYNQKASSNQNWMVLSIALRSLGALTAFLAFRGAAMGVININLLTLVGAGVLGLGAHDLVLAGLNLRDLVTSNWRLPAVRVVSWASSSDQRLKYILRGTYLAQLMN